MYGEQANVIGQFKPNSNASVWQYLQLKLEKSSKFFMKAKSTSVPTDGSTISTIPTSFKYSQYSISRLTNLNTVQEKGRFPSQPHQNPKGIHEVETHEGESSQVRDVKALITLRSVKEANYVPIILGRPFLATSNAIINCRNGLMQLTFGNMTLELNIFHMSKKLITLEEEEGPEEVCIIDTLVEEHYDQNMQDELNESLEDLEEGLSEPADVLATLQGWRRKEEILPLFNKEEGQAM
ncbi:hypothetical protein AAG906_016743 [Vitis piasezkii]